jgi:hypothetical protein
MHTPSIIRTPSGRFVFVGSVPAELAYRMADGSPINVNIINEELMLPASFRTRIKNQSFETYEEAETALNSFLSDEAHREDSLKPWERY